MSIESLKRTDRSRLALPLCLLAAALAVLALAASPASASKTRFLQGTFGSAAQPSFANAEGMAVDQDTGDLIVIDFGAQTVSRYHEDGTPAEFSALGANVIDAKKGSGEKVCAEEPASCDETPQHSFEFYGSADADQVAVDNSGGVTDGNIYITQTSKDLIDVFASTGAYLGQLTKFGTPVFGEPCGVTVDGAGNVYVGDYATEKVHKFVPSANPPVNTDWEQSFTAVHACTLAAGAGTGAGSLFVTAFAGPVSKLDSSTGELQGLVSSDNNTTVSVDPVGGHLFVAETGAVKEYDAPGATLLATYGSGGSGGVAAKLGAANVYVAAGSKVDIYGPLVPFLPEVRTDPATNFAKTSATLNGSVKPDGLELTECLFEYVDEENYEPGASNPYAAGETTACAETPAQIGAGTSFKAVHADLTGLSAETVYHYRLVAANVNGAAKPPGKDETFQTASKPELLGAWAEDVALQEATLKAKINPHSAATTYRFEWGTDSLYGNSTADIPIGSEPTAHTVSLFLEKLTPGTTYHWRVVAKNEIGASTSSDHAFTTFPPSPAAELDCPNQVFRTDAAAFLSDCRAYEMVSPVDKNGGDILSGFFLGDPGGYVQVSPDGNKIAYGAIPSFADQPNSFAINQYLAARQEGEEWSNHGIHPPVTNRPATSVPFGQLRDFMAFSPDLCSAWLIDYQTPPLTPDGQDGHPNLYRRENCGAGAGSLEVLIPSPPLLPPSTPDNYVDKDSVQGISDDARHTIFVAKAAATPEAAATAKAQVYDRFGGGLHLVSVLPGVAGGIADSTGAGVGSGGSRNLEHAVSEDGSRVYWASGFNENGGTGKLYLRQHPEQGIVAGECSEAAKACTLPVSEGNSAFFWTAAADGSKALYSEGADLYEFNLQSKSSQLIVHNVKGVAGASDDLSRIYFVSSEALSGAGQNSEEDEAQAGKPNLYLEDGGTLRFVATLVEGDVGAVEPGAIAPAYAVADKQPYQRATRVTPDGAHIAFESRAPLTGFDNADAANGKPDVEVFAYEAGGELQCVSCNSGGGRPSGEILPQPYFHPWSPGFATDVFAAAWIPTWEHPLHSSNVLSDDGGRLFFNSNEGLLPRDTNGTQDVYEWEQPGVGSCKEESPSFKQSNGGCLYLISSGESPFESEFWEASPDGRDVFFTTESSLLPQDPGLVDLYDARAGGGFPQPNPKAACEGEACQSPPPPPSPPTGASATYQGPGNPPKRPCPKGKRKVRRHGKVRCVKKESNKKQKAHQRGANNNRRAGL
jgi:hypothetical protein